MTMTIPPDTTVPPAPEDDLSDPPPLSMREAWKTIPKGTQRIIKICAILAFVTIIVLPATVAGLAIWKYKQERHAQTPPIAARVAR